MKSAAFSLLAGLSAAGLCGCARFEYRLVEPTTAATRIGKETVSVPCPPVEYGLASHGDHLALRITNPSDQAVTLLASRSYVVDPGGESHPLHGCVLGPHSYVRLSLPPAPATVTGYGYAPYWGYAPFGWGGYPFWPAYDPPYPQTYSFSYQLYTPYDWHWKTGRVRLHLGGQSAGHNFEQNLVFDREAVKR
ncbi:MAG: hypothetical protein ABSF95_01860 [Verrucomicrobiota bacterium]|jgi:hypothetical protein